MKSLERKSEPTLDSVQSSSFPCFYVSDDEMPEVSDWEIDGEYMLTVKVHVANKSQHVDLDGTDTDATLEVLSYEVQK